MCANNAAADGVCEAVQMGSRVARTRLHPS